MSMMSIRAATPRDRAAIRQVEEHAFGQQAEAGLVDALVAGGDAVVELVAVEEGQVVGHILFSRLHVTQADGRSFAAVALAPLGRRAVVPRHRHRRRSGQRGASPAARGGRGAVRRARRSGYYGRFGYRHARADDFDSELSKARPLQALAWGEAPGRARLDYAAAFGSALAA